MRGVPCGPGADQVSGRELIQAAICRSVSVSSWCVTSSNVIAGWGRVLVGGDEVLGEGVVRCMETLRTGVFNFRAAVLREGVALLHVAVFCATTIAGGRARAWLPVLRPSRGGVSRCVPVGGWGLGGLFMHVIGGVGDLARFLVLVFFVRFSIKSMGDGVIQELPRPFYLQVAIPN